MASLDTSWSKENSHYFRLVRIVTELLRDVLWQLLTLKLPGKAIGNEIKNNATKLKLRKSVLEKIKRSERICCSDLDVSSLYSLLRNFCPKLKPPTQGWVNIHKENFPTPKDFRPADDVERIRIIRNDVIAHATETRLSEPEFDQHVSVITGIIKRLDGMFGKGNNNFRFLQKLLTCPMDKDDISEVMNQLKQEKEFDEETRTMVADLTGKVDQLTEEVDQLTEEVDQVHEKSRNVQSQVQILEKDLVINKSHVGHLKEEVDQVHKTTSNVQSQMKSLEQELKDHKESSHMDSPNITVTQSIICGENGKTGVCASSPGEFAIEEPHRPTYATAVAKNIKTPVKCESSGINYNITNKLNITVNKGTKSSHTLSINDLSTKDVNVRKFLKATKEFDDGHYILVTSDIGRNKYLETLALVPWVAVFDFDPNSRTNGLLSVLEDQLTKRKRSLHINCLDDHNLSNVNENSTHWMFCRGCRENANSKESQSYEDWEADEEINLGLKTFCKMLKNFENTYTKYTVLLLMTKNKTLSEFALRLLTKLKKYLKPNVVLMKSEIVQEEDSTLFEQMLIHKFKDTLTSVFMDVKDCCEVIGSLLADTNGKNGKGYDIPTVDKTNRIKIDAKQMSWLEEDLFILYRNRHNDPSQLSQCQLQRECDNFFKGGTLPWYVWYGVDEGHFDVKRELTDKITETIKTKYLSQFKSGLITLYHAPGCGGTTLAQRVIWELRKQTPCAQEKLRSNSTVEDLVSRLDFLYEKTGLPILLLIDGEDKQRVDHLYHCLKRPVVIIFNVSRYVYSVSKMRNSDNEFWLGRYVSIKESNVLCLKFCDQVSGDEEKKKTIQKLASEVKNGKKKSIYEFGLAAFSYEYRGLEKFVSGFLDLSSANQPGSLGPWNFALIMLSTAWYYGHIGIACHFFTEIPNIKWKKCRKVPTLEDFPENLQCLIVKDETENRSNIIRISNFYVAKEILEQLLPWPKPRPDKRMNNLVLDNKKSLEQHAIELITYTGKIDKGNHDSSIVKILTRIFIIRDRQICHVGVDHEANADFRNDKISLFFQDLLVKPDCTELFTVMTQLTQSFPQDPHFFAHLGRLFTLFRPQNERDAESNFKKALGLCDTLTKGQRIDEMTYHMKISYSITHFMFATMFRRRIAGFTGWHSKQKSRQHTNTEEFDKKATKLLEMAKKARGHYQYSRKYDPDVYNQIYAYIHEIHICLMFCDFLFKNGGYPDILQFIERNDNPASRFAEECIYEIDDLFLEFFMTVEPDDIDDTVKEYQTWYRALFKNIVPTTHEKIIIREESVHANRIHIAAIKLRYANETGGGYVCLEDIQFEKEMIDIIEKYEKIFSQVHEQGYQVKPVCLDKDYREWLIAIRSKLLSKPYSLEKVLQKVNAWDKKIHSLMSTFYLFVLKSILGFGTEESLGSTHNLIEARKLKLDVKKYKHLQSKYPKEWLGRGPGIQQMMFLQRVFSTDRGDQEKKAETVGNNDLALMKGTIKHPNNNPRFGYISLDLGKENNVSVDVFFVPINFKMHFKAFAQVRVEFNIAFTFTNGYEAFNLRVLKKVCCEGCKMDVEATSRDKTVRCPCGTDNVVESGQSLT